MRTQSSGPGGSIRFMYVRTESAAGVFFRLSSIFSLGIRSPNNGYIQDWLGVSICLLYFAILPTY